jgi:hypothetical protein
VHGNALASHGKDRCSKLVVVASRAYVRFDEGFRRERPRIWAEAAGRRRNFSDLSRAVRWAELRADKVTVVVDDLGRWEDWPANEHERERIDAYVRRRLRRFDDEYRARRRDAAEWFYAVRDPDVQDRETLAKDLAAQPEVLSVKHDDRWWVVRVRARTATQAETLANDAFMRIAWADDRIDREIGRGRDSYAWFVTLGGVTVFGLAEYEEETLEQARRWR